MSMKKLVGIAFLTAFSMISLTGCDKVGVGQVGIKVNKYYGRGINNDDVVGTGAYWVGFNTTIYEFPTFSTTYIYKDGEAIGFQSSEGLTASADVGITYHIDRDNVIRVFQKYKKGIDEITAGPLHNLIRDAFIEEGSLHPIEDIYGKGKTDFLKAVQARAVSKAADGGITIESVSLVTSFRMPEQVQDRINAAVNASIMAQTKRNELAQTEADAAKKVAEARGNADAARINAQGIADYNRIVSSSLTDELLRYEEIRKWNGSKATIIGASPVVDARTSVPAK